MIKSVLAAGILVGVITSAGFAPSAEAIPLPKIGVAQSGGPDSVILVRRGGGGGGGFAMRGSGGGGLATRSAGPKFGGFTGGGRSFNRGAFVGGIKLGSHPQHGHKHRGARGFVYYGVPAYYGYSNTFAADQCAWIYRKAIRTNTRYWWNRYQDCRDDYGY